MSLLFPEVHTLTAWVTYLVLFFVVSIFVNILKQVLFKDRDKPPVIPHLIPFIGNAVEYGQDPYKFLFKCREKYGDVFTFILLGKKMTVCLGTEGNDFILNGRLQDVNAEEIYTRLTTPVFGSGVVYDCSNARLMEQKKFLKFGLTTEALNSYVPLIKNEFDDYVNKSRFFKGSNGVFPVSQVMAELTIFTASRTLQGKEVRQKFDSTFADLYHHLDMGFTPINFILPWFPLPANRKRDHANHVLTQTYVDIINSRRESTAKGEEIDRDMIWNLMSCRYKNGTKIPDHEIAHMMIALLMAGQHSSSSTGSWIMLRLASRPDVMEQLYQEQLHILGAKAMLDPPTHEDIRGLHLNSLVVKETLRLHAPIHSIMRAVKSPLQITTRGTSGAPKIYNIPTSHTLLSAPGVTANSREHFSNPTAWDPHRWQTIISTEGAETIDYGYGLVTKGATSPYLPFGAGRHRCIGEQFAYLQLGTITALMVREFHFGKITVLPRTDYSSLFSRPMQPTVVEWRRRNKEI